MNCPVCDTRLRPVEKYGVEVDICPDCKGVWLDRGELDKILDMAANGGPAEYREPVERDRREPVRDSRDDRAPRDDREDRRREDDRIPRDERDYRGPERKRRGSWLGDIFESFGGGGDD